ncbi:cyclin-dependent kinase inhibitor 1B-like [Megalops cyprinoides]|uniref:cyclin-dependent kinase inhibitor 1B-like n=1 Tax=Megalops cyprinoides TaxID=118141 RepID=UPI001864C4C8|nr:cyclin-dependent kinase inhibitor 1B-like [Megalops cyprinoides]
MSNVRLSNGSPTSERMDGRLSDHPKSSARRSLFGSVDHEELKKDLKGQLEGMEDASSAKWNFDFANNKPLSNGRFEWQVVDSKDLPEFYNRPHRAPKNLRLSGNNNVDLNGNRNCLRVTPCQESPGERKLRTEQKTEKSEDPMDYKDQCSGQRKRPASHDSLDEVTCGTVLAHSVEDTPVKPSPKSQT